MSGKISTGSKHQLTIEEELFQAADKKIAELNKLGVAQGRTDISEPERQHLPVLVDLGDFENWLWDAESYVIDKRLKRQREKSDGEKINVEDILKGIPVAGELKKCQSVMVLAPAGMGKTTLLRRIAHNVRRGEYKELEGKLVLMLDFRPYLKEKKIIPSQVLLGDMFSDWGSERMKQRYQWIIDNPEKVVFVIDSLDTLPFDLDKKASPRLSNRPEYHKAATADVILRNILAKDWFAETIIISSSREYKVRNLHPSFRPDRCILLDGLTEESVQDLIDGFLGKVRGEEVKNYITTECPDVWPLLSIPVVLVFSMIGFVENGFKPKTISGILIKFFQSLIRSSHAHVENVLIVFNKLLPLAFEGTRTLCVLFTPEYMKRFGLEPEEVTDLGALIPQSYGAFLSTKLIQNDGFLLYFNHQTQQEALAALHVMSLLLAEFKTFMEVEVWLQQFTVVRRLIFGTLLNDEVLEAAQDLTEISDVDQKKHIMIRSLDVALEECQGLFGDKTKLLELFIDLSECREEGVTELIRSSVKKIALPFLSLSPSDVQAVAFMMKQCEYLEEVKLKLCRLDDEKMKILANTIEQSNVKFKEFNVGANEELGVEGAHLLGKLVRNHEVEDLGASHRSIQGCEALKKFIEGLGDAKIGYLNLSDYIMGGTDCPLPLIRSLLDLLPHVEKKLDLVDWNISESQQQELQQKLNEIGSPSLEVRIGEYRSPVVLKASLMDSTSESEITSEESDDDSVSVTTSEESNVVEEMETETSGEASTSGTGTVIPSGTSVAPEQSVYETKPRSTISEKEEAGCGGVETGTSDETSTSGISIVRPRGTLFSPKQSENETNLESTIAVKGDVDRGAIGTVARLSAEIERRIKTESTKSKSVGAAGGVLVNFGSKVPFSREAYNKDTKVQTSVITDFSDCPTDRVPIAPSIKCSPSGKLNKPGFVQSGTFDETFIPGPSIVRPRGTSFSPKQSENETNLEFTTAVEGNADRVAIETVAKLSAEIERRIKTESTKSKIIGAAGGVLVNFGSKVTFSGKAYNKDTKVQTSVITDFSDCPADTVPIAPSIKCSPSGKLNKPALVEIDHWAFTTADDFYVDIYRKDDENSERRFFKKVRIEGNRRISFHTEHFSIFSFLVKRALSARKKIRRQFFLVAVQNHVYINGTEQTIACVCCLKDEKVKNDVIQSLEGQGYVPLLPLPETALAICGEEVKIAIKCLQPRNLYKPTDKEGEKMFSIDEIIRKCQKPFYLRIGLKKGDLSNYKGFLEFLYSHTAGKDKEVTHRMSKRWPIIGALPAITNINMTGKNINFGEMTATDSGSMNRITSESQTGNEASEQNVEQQGGATSSVTARNYNLGQMTSTEHDTTSQVFSKSTRN